jgi:peptide-methionine (S)-S-oxide reductase
VYVTVGGPADTSQRMLFSTRNKTTLVNAENALPGRTDALSVPAAHAVLGTPLTPPFPEGIEVAYFGLGCFWGAERAFWTLPGVYTTAVGYQGGITPNPTYEEVCSGRTGHTEAVLVAFDPTKISYEELLKAFWEAHDPTQGMRQGNDIGTQYRSAIYTVGEEQAKQADLSRRRYDDALAKAGKREITTEIAPAGEFFYAEGYHQQYLAPTKNPNGYCGLGGTGVSCPIGLGVQSAG